MILDIDNFYEDSFSVSSRRDQNWIEPKSPADDLAGQYIYIYLAWTAGVPSLAMLVNHVTRNQL